ncbi:acetylxylan esterase [Mucilaginibacter lappiensis]|uniref:Cephalosporin-C deacetylase n=1 Tax=Mucilaginibacter lappiensis TaxID=354630 RepID=A0A1N7G699_9SPHI|nr:acetylxylan esterase [Mucilaginibacter lappiensis]MBB6112851.1 cephalosporin-C deacetylase [Mucilaginibacter lappiensis]MBB6131446.1 cephalosporin-C deacetylase [Mucilaginibacter lappiensis]SIS08133.1 cephalosporin-C deacetylase [Mucilaginibacter lappiensis]
MRNINIYLKHTSFWAVLIVVAILLPVTKANAFFLQQKNKEGEVILDAKPANKNALFKAGEEISYKLSVKNTYNEKQEGKFSYIVTSDDGKKIFENTADFSVGAGSSKSLSVKVAPKAAGFYHINFMFNLSAYDDTVRKVFGVNPEAITSELHKPDDFDQFWEETRQQLSKVSPQYKVIFRPDLSTKYKKVYSVEMKSYENLLIRGWLVIPTDGSKFPVHYRVPGYVVELKPNMDNDDYIAFDINVRGNGNSKDVVHINTDNYSTTNIQDKDKYIYRGVYMDCLRGLDFLYSHANLGIDTSKIFVEGGSQGGALAVVTAGLDKRVKVLTMQVPLYADIRDNYSISASYKEQVVPFKMFRQYKNQHPEFTWEQFYATFDYYDPQNFAPMVKCPVLMGIGLLDQFCPPRCSMALFNHLGSTNKEFVCVPNSTHEVDFNYFMFQNLWVREKFRIP